MYYSIFFFFFVESFCYESLDNSISRIHVRVNRFLRVAPVEVFFFLLFLSRHLFFFFPLLVMVMVSQRCHGKNGFFWFLFLFGGFA